MTQRTLELLVLALAAIAAVVVAVAVYRWSRDEDRRLEDLRRTRSGANTATSARPWCGRCGRRRATGRSDRCEICFEIEAGVGLAVDQGGWDR